MPHRDGQLFSRESRRGWAAATRVLQSPIRMSRCPTKLRCQAGARSPASSEPSLTSGESRVLYTAYLPGVFLQSRNITTHKLFLSRMLCALLQDVS